MADNYEIRNAEIEKLLKDIGRILKGTMPPGYGFTLFIFGYHEDRSLFYLSSAEREDMVAAIKEFLQKIEKG